MTLELSGTIAVYVAFDYKASEVTDAINVCELANFVLEKEGFQPVLHCESEEADANGPAADACEADWEVSITFVDNNTIAQLNADYRGIDKPTDVLSFECDGACEEEEDEALTSQCFGPKQLGDIFVATDVAQAQSKEYGLTLGEELSLLVTHGLLHLCRWDHIEDGDALAMEARETELLSAFWNTPFARHRLDS